jgi:REP element-mobilizing transposase RayT
MARPPRIEFPGAIYHVTARGNERKEIFRDDDDRLEYLGRLARYRRRFGFDLLAYCLMTNHVHMAIRTSTPPLSRAMASLQSSYAHWFNRRHERVGHLFEGRYKAFLVQEERYFAALIGYIHMNPVRAGIVTRSEKYFWSSDRFLLTSEHHAPFDRRATLELLGLTTRTAPASYRATVPESLAAEYEQLPEVGQLVKGEEDYGLEQIGRSGRVEPPFKGLTEEGLVSAVADATGISIKLLRGLARGERLTAARSIAGYVGKSFAAISLRRTARYLGREESYLSRPVSSLTSRLETDPRCRRVVDSVLTRLRSRPSGGSTANQD